MTTAAVLTTRPAGKKIPPLPERKGKRKWTPQAVEFWKEIWNSEMASEFNDVDIQGLHLLIDMVDTYWKLPAKEIGKKKEMANEIRLQRQCFGLTPLDRMRLQWQTEKTDSAKVKGQKRRNAPVKNYKVDPRKVLEEKN